MLTIRTGYAVLALACLHGNEDRWVLAQEIATRADIPKPYLHKILHALGKAGVIKTKRGYRGGMSLAKPAKKINLFDLAEAVEGSKWMNRCLLGLSECSDERACPTHEFWTKQRRLVAKKLKSINLAQVADFEGRSNGRIKSLDEVREELAKLT